MTYTQLVASQLGSFDRARPRDPIAESDGGHAMTAIPSSGDNATRRPLLADHTHSWRYIRTDEDWFDGDETDVYECSTDGCNARDWRYIPR